MPDIQRPGRPAPSVMHLHSHALRLLVLAICVLACACSRMSSTVVKSANQAALPPLDECTNAPADWIFCSSFEETVSPWFEEYGVHNRIADPGPAYRVGNHVGRTRVNPGRGGAGFVAKLASHQKLFLRYYVQWEPGLVMTDAHHGPGGLMADEGGHLGQSGRRPSGRDFIAAGLEAGATPPFPIFLYTYYHGMYQDCPPLASVNPPPDSCYGDTLPCISDRPGVTYYCKRPDHRPGSLQGVVPGRWYCLEEAVDAGTPALDADSADGELALWLDGQPLGRFKQLWMRTSNTLAFNVLWLYLFFHGDHSASGLLFDDVVVSRSRVGCHAV